MNGAAGVRANGLEALEMLYAAMAFWLMVIVLSARAVHLLWSGMVNPRTVNIALLPGTLVAQMGHVLGLLVTGATVSNTALVRDDETAAPEHTADAKPRIPVIGPVIVGMLPLITCALAILAAAAWLGGSTVEGMTARSVGQSLPTTLGAFWQLLREQISLMEAMLAAILQTRVSDWHAWLFVYLVICLTVRMAPFPGNLRGSLGAIVVLGIVAALAGRFIAQTRSFILSGWSVLSLAVSMLLLLLVLTLLLRGAVSLAKLLARNG